MDKKEFDSKLKEMNMDFFAKIRYPLIAAGIKASDACLLAYFEFWSDKTADSEGWIYKTQKELMSETGLKIREIEGARNRLKKIGVIDEKISGYPRRIFYKINFERVIQFIEITKCRNYKMQKQQNVETTKHDDQNPKTGFCTSQNMMTKILKCDDQNPKTGFCSHLNSNARKEYAENTQENTTKITQNTNARARESYPQQENIPVSARSARCDIFYESTNKDFLTVENENEKNDAGEEKTAEPRQSHQKKKKTSPRSNLWPSSSQYDDVFEEIWQLYPRRVGKGAAKKSLLREIKIKKTSEERKEFVEFIKTKIYQYADSVRHKDAIYIPHPATWINQQRWGDEIEQNTVSRRDMSPSERRQHDYEKTLAEIEKEIEEGRAKKAININDLQDEYCEELGDE